MKFVVGETYKAGHIDGMLWVLKTYSNFSNMMADKETCQYLAIINKPFVFLVLELAQAHQGNSIAVDNAYIKFLQHGTDSILCARQIEFLRGEIFVEKL